MVDLEEGRRILEWRDHTWDVNTQAGFDAHAIWMKRWKEWLAENGAALIEEVKGLRLFYKETAKTPCEGGCGEFQAVLQDSEHGQRTRVGEWLCSPCHSKVCELDVTLPENRFHNCKALRD